MVQGQQQIGRLLMIHWYKFTTHRLQSAAEIIVRTGTIWQSEILPCFIYFLTTKMEMFSRITTKHCDEHSIF